MTNKYPMMTCGHTANAISNGKPACVICDCFDVASEKLRPSLEGRQAQCPYCKRTTDSKWSLAFFQYRGPGSRRAIDLCECGYFRRTHDWSNSSTGKCPHRDHWFVPHGPFEYDEYYCGCRGWN